MPGGRQFVEGAAGCLQQTGGVQGEMRGVCLGGCGVAAGAGGCRGVVVDGASVAVLGGVERSLRFAVDDGEAKAEVPGMLCEFAGRGGVGDRFS
nr:hypothetical protein [Streptomyces sp. ET3-23]